MNKYLARCGVASRRKANVTIAQGRIIVNNCRIKDIGLEVDPQKDRIYLDGHPLAFPEHFSYILMNKSKGVITAVEDDRGRKTVLDFISVKDRIFPVGRLDYDTEGVLLLTNDGELAYRLTHPNYNVEKVYRTWVEGHVSNDKIRNLTRGVEIDPGMIVKGESEILKKRLNQTLVEIRVHEGKKRQIKRMMKSIGHPVLYLERSRFAGLTVDDLQRGQWRELTEIEVNSLYRQTGLKGMLYEPDKCSV